MFEPMQSLIIICGQEGVGKSTLAKAITSHLKNGASFDAENILQVNPFEFSAAFQALAIKNSVDLIHNFYAAGYEAVVAGSFINDRKGYDAFRKLLNVSPKIYIVMLNAAKQIRDDRRIKREKPTSKEIRELVDTKCPPDPTLRDSQKKADYIYLEVDNSELTVDTTIECLRHSIPDVFR